MADGSTTRTKSGTSRRAARPEPAPPAPLADNPGDRLRNAREALGWSISDVGRRTCIGERYLTALEANDDGAFRSVVYTIGFARSYARAVGADEHWVVDRIRERTVHLRDGLLLTHRIDPLRSRWPWRRGEDRD